MAIMKTFAAECVKLDGQVLSVKVIVDDCFRTCGLERFEDYVDASDNVFTCVFATTSQGKSSRDTTFLMIADCSFDSNFFDLYRREVRWQKSLT